MSATKVDVLAILDRTHAELDGYDDFYPLQYELQEARNAVAELIEADRKFDSCNIAGGTSESWDSYYAAKARRAAALANIGGQP